jgi:hypothetical protein
MEREWAEARRVQAIIDQHHADQAKRDVVFELIREYWRCRHWRNIRPSTRKLRVPKPSKHSRYARDIGV